MGDYEVLTSRFSDESRVRTVFRDVFSDTSPHPLEHGGRTGEMNACEIPMVQDYIADDGRIARDKVDHSGRQTGSFEETEQLIIAVDRRAGAFPHHGITHDG